MYNLTQKLIAEFIGTFALIFFGAGAVCVDMQLRTNATGGIGLLAIALAHGLAIAIMVSSMGHISGGHFNPAVTIGFWVTKKLSTMDTLFLLAGTTGGCGGGGVFAARGDTGGSVAKRSTGYAGIDAGFSELGGIGAGGDDYVLPGVCGVRDGGG